MFVTVPGLPKPTALQGQVQDGLRNLLVSALQVSNDVAGELFVFVRQQRVRRALQSGSSRTAYPVSVCVDVTGDIVIDYGANVGNIEAPGRDVRGYLNRAPTPDENPGPDPFPL